MNRVAEVNREIRKLYGSEMRLRRGQRYYYITGGPADAAFRQGIYVYRASDLTVEQWLDEVAQLLKGER